MSCLVAFHYRSYGTFFLHKIGSIISIGGLPTTNIIEPFYIVYIIIVLFYFQLLREISPLFSQISFPLLH
ncbi:hypothetical protein AZJ96_08745 [Streptococcus pneumoniae]|nr:hypothetical protein AZK07_06295 [Streptococcus pneumoniae]TXM06476.1 hypothetical protein AZJ96_08745 [Streptococcus pneumoniae]